MRPLIGRWIRSAMFTPWFAVSAGIVIAASLTLATPHPALTFPPSKTARCIKVGCASSSPAPSGPAPAIKHEVRLPPPQGHAKVEYKLLRSNHDHFVAVILIVSRRSLSNWRLRFVMPGATINDIWGATDWRPDRHGGVIVDGSPSPWLKSGDNEARIIVFGTGGTAGARTPAWPTGCAFGNQRCTFRALPRNADFAPGNRERWRHHSGHEISGD